MNKVMLIGRLTKDPEQRMMPNGTAVATASLAVNRDYKNQNGEYDTDFINIVLFDKKAEFLCNYARKGDKIGVSGRWQHRSYDDNKGNTRHVDECVVEQVELLSPKKQEQATAATTETRTPPTSKNDNPFVDDNFTFYDEDLPF